MAMPRLAGSDDFALRRVDGGEQRGRAVPLVVVGHRAAAATMNRQTLLCAVPGLNLGLLVATEHERMCGWVQVQAHDIPQLLRKVRIIRQLEGLTKCGWRPLADHTRCTVALLTPTALAIVRVLPCVAPFDFSGVVLCSIS